VNGSCIDRRLRNGLASRAPKIEGAFDGSRPDIIAGTGVGSPSSATLGPASVRYAGSFLVSYTLDSGFGVSSTAWA
jgi:hypothetical protein